ncbi:MAG: hypothetical protein JNL21_10660 [Myxococcales bacterium]|nr:hypothetical protein [Myxococcales bacterium]
MALPVPHYYQILHSPGVVARVTVNDIPFYRRAVDFAMSPAGPFNHMIVPGDNVVVLELTPAPGPVPPTVTQTFDFRIMRESDDRVVFRAKWPDLVDYPKPEKGDPPTRYLDQDKRLPAVYTGRFEPDFENPRPIWLDAPTGAFPAEGTREQHDAVLELYEAFRRRDVDGFLAASELKLAEHRRFYGAIPELAPDVAKARYGEMLREPWNLDPYDPSQLVFERRAEGRAAYVTRKDGTPALQARHQTDPSQAWRANLLLTRAEGRWRIFW